jgi:tetratricopeptide (TPR) repeat protein
MRRALLPENVNRFTTELQPIVDLRRKIKAILIARTKAQNPPQADGQISAAGHAAIGDAYFAAGDMKTALLEYRACGTDDSTPTPDRNRLALGNLSNAQYTEAGRILRSLMLTKKDDSATRAIDGLLMLRELKFADARAAVQNDVTAHVPAALLIAAFADMALGKHTEAASEAREATHLLPNAADAQYALAVVSPDINESDRALAHALTLAPFQSGPYLRFAERVALTKDASRERIEEALSIAAYILKYDPDNVAALLLQAMLYCQTDRAALAEPILAALLKRDNTSLDILMGGAVYGRVADQPEKRGAFMDTIRKYFPDRSDEMDLIISPAGMLYTLDVKYAYRPYAFLCPTTLYPAK